MISEKSCRQCGEPLKGRADKKFCDDQCRSNYNNKVYSTGTAEMRNINNILRKNRRILGSVLKTDGKGKISRFRLADQGFNFRFFTHMHTTRKGTTYKLCYDFGYLAIENDLVVVVRWD